MIASQCLYLFCKFLSKQNSGLLSVILRFIRRVCMNKWTLTKTRALSSNAICFRIQVNRTKHTHFQFSMFVFPNFGNRMKSNFVAVIVQVPKIMFLIFWRYFSSVIFLYIHFETYLHIYKETIVDVWIKTGILTHHLYGCEADAWFDLIFKWM